MKDCAPCVDSSALPFAASPSRAAFQNSCPVIVFPLFQQHAFVAVETLVKATKKTWKR
jgi:hypothetical protein